MGYPEHNKDCFYKYTSASTAVKILESSTVRYSSPIQFNDPFDVQSGLHFDFDIESLPDKLLQRIEQLVSLDAKPNVSETDPWGKAIILMWKKKATHDFPKNKLWESFRPALASLKDQVVLFQAQYQQNWWTDFLPRLRVFSVSEEKDNLLMWSHYAKHHTGVAFEFRVLPEQDNPLCVAKPVQYRKVPPPLFTEEQWIDDILSLHPLEPTPFFFQYAYVKSEIWFYEKEWRVWDLLDKAQQTLCSDYPLLPNEIGSIYLGCKIDPDMKAAIIKLLSKTHPNAKVFQARKASDEFKLDFDAI